MISRRLFLLAGSAGLAAAAFPSLFPPVTPAAAESFPVTKSDAEWKAQLSDAQYQILRHEDTERPFTSALNHEKRAGTFHCVGCDQALYDSSKKFDSGTGWPSFWDARPKAIGTREDGSFGMVRTECHCSRCGGHLGHIFNGGPQPTGMRHCINGEILTFRPGETPA